MEALKQIKEIVASFRSEHGADATHKLEIEILRYQSSGYTSELCAQEPLCCAWPDIQRLLDGVDTNSRAYVSDVIDMKDLRTGKLNLVFAPCGSGKTHFVENVLKNVRKRPGANMLYLAPTVALVHALKFRGESYLTTDGHGHFVREWRHAGITAMTYAAFASIIRREREAGTYDDAKLWNDHAIICADELSQGVSQSHFTDKYGNRIPDEKNLTKIALKELEIRIRNKRNLVVTVSATPKRLIGRYPFDVRMVGMFLRPRGYRDGEVRNYSDLHPLLNQIDPDKRGLIYISRVKKMLEAVDVLESRGIPAVAIYSRHHEDHPMGDEQLRAVESLEMDEKIPDDVQVLIINAAYETGLNIQPEKSHLDYVIVHDINEDTQVQARGRYRGDIDVVYHKVEPSSETQIIDPEKLAPYIGERLRKADKDRLLEAFGFLDDHLRPMRWPTFVKLLEEQGHTVKKSRDKIGRYDQITD